MQKKILNSHLFLLPASRLACSPLQINTSVHFYATILTAISSLPLLAGHPSQVSKQAFCCLSRILCKSTAPTDAQLLNQFCLTRLFPFWNHSKLPWVSTEETLWIAATGFLPSRKEGRLYFYLCLSVCLSVCLPDNSKSYKWILMSSHLDLVVIQIAIHIRNFLSENPWRSFNSLSAF